MESFTVTISNKKMTFEKKGNEYYCQEDKVKELCSKTLYEEARRLWAKQHGAIGCM